MASRGARKVLTGCLAALVVLLSSSAPASTWAGDAGPRVVTIDVKDADIHNVFRLLSRVGGINIVVADGVSGRVTVRLVDVPWADAFNAILVAERLGVVKVGDILVVDTLQHIAERAKQRLEASDAGTQAAPLRTIVIPVNYARAEDLARIIAGVLTERGSVMVDQRTNTLIVTDVDDSLAQVQAITE